MNEFQHLRTLVAVLVGLALSNLATSLHHLLRERHRVRWDWLAPCAALFAALQIVHFWFSFYSFGRAQLLTRLGPVLLLLLQLLQVVLLACSALPDGAGELDLRRYYAEQSRYFWLVAGSYLLGVMVWSLVLNPSQSLEGRLGWILPDLVLVGLFLLLAVVRSRRLHALLVPLVCLLTLAGFSWLQLG